MALCSPRRADHAARNPIDAPALITVEPEPVIVGQGLLILVNTHNHANWSALFTLRGGAPESALTGIAGIDHADRPTIRLSPIGIAAGTYDAVLPTPEDIGLARRHFSIIPKDGQAFVGLASDRVISGHGIAEQFSGATGFRFDWVWVSSAGELQFIASLDLPMPEHGMKVF